jgi:hypothetical protein
MGKINRRTRLNKIKARGNLSHPVKKLRQFALLGTNMVSVMNPSGFAERICVPRVCDPSEHLESQVQQRMGSRVRNLHVIVRHDGVILQGRAATYHAKQLAQHAAMELADLPILANDIQVF